MVLAAILGNVLDMPSAYACARCGQRNDAYLEDQLASAKALELWTACLRHVAGETIVGGDVDLAKTEAALVNCNARTCNRAHELAHGCGRKVSACASLHTALHGLVLVSRSHVAWLCTDICVTAWLWKGDTYRHGTRPSRSPCCSRGLCPGSR